ncbi:hypothetical protein AQUCO_00500046v1 [Aquilegia coerulea]|uniref:Glycosyltransferase n=1 Tax=Aquilegia coerulea TaxID=218851 RepID=A0A2G5EQ27_AQUCA|nr:hypothetical protein AQUCO_00500046v1 [Aquilegia coerulea]
MYEQQQEWHQRRGRRRLVLFPCPLQGHINPMLQLATLLHSHYQRILSITIVHIHFNSPNSSKYPDFTFLPISDGLSPSQSTKDVIALLSLLNHNCANPFRECLINEILSQQNEPPVACIISDAIMHFTQSVADSLQLPRIVLRTSSPTNFVIFAAFPLLRQRGYLPIKESELEAPVPELPPLKVKDIPMIKTGNLEGLFTLISEMVNQTKASAGLIWNSFESLEQTSLESLRHEFPAPNFAIGPFHKFAPAISSSLLTQDRSCLSWLNTQAPSSVIYISFGSIAAIDEAQLVEMALGIAHSGQPFLWVIRPGLVVDHDKSGQEINKDVDLTKFLPQKVKEMMKLHSGRGCIVKWAPQLEVLAHPAVGGFWTHSGWNSTLESICEGVPMLCWACFGDQMVSARYVSEVWRVGFQLENGLQHGEIETYIKRLMVQENNREREEMIERVKDLQERAELCIKKGGSSFKSLENLTDYIFSLKIRKARLA